MKEADELLKDIEAILADGMMCGYRNRPGTREHITICFPDIDRVDKWLEQLKEHRFGHGM